MLLERVQAQPIFWVAAKTNNKDNGKVEGPEKVKRSNRGGLYAKLKIKKIHFKIVNIQFNANFDSFV